MQEFTEEFFTALDSAIAGGKPFIASKEDFNHACSHIVPLLKDAALLFKNGSNATSIFISITAMEESAKAHISLYRRPNSEFKRSKDALFRHEIKHQLAVPPTVAMGVRLRAAMGNVRVNELFEMAYRKQFVSLREKSLYFDNQNSKLTVPHASVTSRDARDILLFAIEVFDDGLVGYTDHSMNLGRETTRIFEEIEAT